MLNLAARRLIRGTFTVTLVPARRKTAAAPDSEGRFAEDGYSRVKQVTNFIGRAAGRRAFVAAEKEKAPGHDLRGFVLLKKRPRRAQESSPSAARTFLWMP
jgi:hypothetical protein